MKKDSASMKTVSAFAAVLLLACVASPDAQAQPPAVQEVIDALSLDSLVATVRVLSGEVGSKNGGTSDTIYSRDVRKAANALAAEYLMQKLMNLGLRPQQQKFTDFFWAMKVEGANVLAEQSGTLFPSRKYILGSHFDSYTYPDAIIAPGADDNASGCAALLETARLVSRYKTAYSVVYAFWDAEELGTWGSAAHADSAAAQGDTILGVVNLDMLGWDGENDSVMAIQASDIGQSSRLADTLTLVCRRYGLGLKPVVHNPGAYSSDHREFWWHGYGAVSFGEESPLNPHYHKTSDRLEYFNLSYFHNLAKLAAGSIAMLADIKGPLAVQASPQTPGLFLLEQNYPNPFNPSTTIRYGLPSRSHVTLTVVNTLGQEVATLVQGEQEAGFHEAVFDATGLASGVYLYRLTAGSYVETRKLVLVR